LTRQVQKNSEKGHSAEKKNGKKSLHENLFLKRPEVILPSFRWESVVRTNRVEHNQPLENRILP
jgi:hypothetical protein